MHWGMECRRSFETFIDSTNRCVCVRDFLEHVLSEWIYSTSSCLLTVFNIASGFSCLLQRVTAPIMPISHLSPWLMNDFSNAYLKSICIVNVQYIRIHTALTVLTASPPYIIWVWVCVRDKVHRSDGIGLIKGVIRWDFHLRLLWSLANFFKCSYTWL